MFGGKFNPRRRKFLGNSLAVAAGTALVPANAGGSTLTATDKLPPAVPGAGSQLQADIQLLLAWTKKLSNRAPSAVSIPFATLPLNFYLRCPADLQAAVPPPRLAELQDMVCTGDQDKYVEILLSCCIALRLAEDTRTKPVIIPAMPKRHLQKQELWDRIASPRFVCDVDELEPWRCLLGLIGCYNGCVAEFKQKWDAVLARDLLLTPVVSKITPPTLVVRREGYMIEFWMYMGHCSIAKPRLLS